MLKKTITYTDYNGIERTESFYFHLNESELTEWELTTEGGMIALIDNIINAKNTTEIIKLFKTLLFKSYGVKSDDGRRFIKSEELSIAFSQTPAYNQLYMELATKHDAASEFVNGVIPKKEPANNGDKSQHPALQK